MIIFLLLLLVVVVVWTLIDDVVVVVVVNDVFGKLSRSSPWKISNSSLSFQKLP